MARDKLGRGNRDDVLEEDDGPLGNAPLLGTNRDDLIRQAALKGDGYEREPIGTQDGEVRQGRDISDSDRLKMFMDTFINSSLPGIPEIPGFHLCWLSTTNTRDTVAARLRVGYVLVKPEEIPGYENYKITNGQYEGLVGQNEMLLAKLPASLYQLYMTEVHHNLPAEEAAKLRYSAEQYAEQAQAEGADVLISKGMRELDKKAKVPDFNDPNWGRLQPYGAS